MTYKSVSYVFRAYLPLGAALMRVIWLGNWPSEKGRYYESSNMKYGGPPRRDHCVRSGRAVYNYLDTFCPVHLPPNALRITPQIPILGSWANTLSKWNRMNYDCAWYIREKVIYLMILSLRDDLENGGIYLLVYSLLHIFILIPA